MSENLTIREYLTIRKPTYTICANHVMGPAITDCVVCKLAEAVRLLEKAYNELNEIHARDGVPYTHMGWKSSVDQDYFTSVVEDCRAFLTSLKERT